MKISYRKKTYDFCWRKVTFTFYLFSPILFLYHNDVRVCISHILLYSSHLGFNLWAQPTKNPVMCRGRFARRFCITNGHTIYFLSSHNSVFFSHGQSRAREKTLINIFTYV